MVFGSPKGGDALGFNDSEDLCRGGVLWMKGSVAG